jgi:hypothetical protein
MPLPGIELRSPGHPVRSHTLYWLSYPGSSVTNYPAFFGIKVFDTVFLTFRHWTLSRATQIKSASTQAISLFRHCNSRLSSTSRSSKLSLSFSFSDYTNSSSLHTDLILFDMIQGTKHKAPNCAAFFIFLLPFYITINFYSVISSAIPRRCV